jgi:hypothetical protein
MGRWFESGLGSQQWQKVTDIYRFRYPSNQACSLTANIPKKIQHLRFISSAIKKPSIGIFSLIQQYSKLYIIAIVAIQLDNLSIKH